jgi:hypothetical protein
MVNDEIQYTDKFNILTYPIVTNGVVVWSPDCNGYYQNIDNEYTVDQK